MNSHFLRFDNIKKILILDLETFNLCLSFIHNRPWQIATMLVQGDKIIETSESYIKWADCDLGISTEAATITKFNQRVFDARARLSKSVFNEFYPKIENADWIIMHNGLGFDLYLLRDWYKAMGKCWKHLPNKIIDTNCLARGIKFDCKLKPEDDFLEYQYRMMNKRQKGVKTSLTALGKEYNISHDYDNLHDAICDIDLNRKVWNALKHQIEI